MTCDCIEYQADSDRADDVCTCGHDAAEHASDEHGTGGACQASTATRPYPPVYGPANPQCFAQDATGLNCAGPAGHPGGSDHANVNGTWPRADEQHG
jgi:hypothetical protein